MINSCKNVSRYAFLLKIVLICGLFSEKSMSMEKPRADFPEVSRNVFKPQNELEEVTPPSTISQHSTSSDEELSDHSSEGRKDLYKEEREENSWTLDRQIAWDEGGKNLLDRFWGSYPLERLKLQPDMSIKEALDKEFSDPLIRKQAIDAAWTIVASSEIEDVEIAAQYLRIAAIGGSVAAMSDWAGCLRQGYGVEKNIALGNAWRVMAAKLGDQDAAILFENPPQELKTPAVLKELFPDS